MQPKLQTIPNNNFITQKFDRGRKFTRSTAKKKRKRKIDHLAKQKTRHKLNSKFLLYRDDLAKGATIPCTHALTGSQFHEKDLS